MFEGKFHLKGQLNLAVCFSISSFQIINFKSRSEEHTSELQSLRHLVCRLLLEKKKQYKPIVRVRTSPANHSVRKSTRISQSVVRRHGVHSPRVRENTRASCRTKK